MNKRETHIIPYKRKMFNPKLIFNLIHHIWTVLVLYYVIGKTYTMFYDSERSYTMIVLVYCVPAYTIAFSLMIGFYFVLYGLQLPFFEQFKVNNLEWPWIEDNERFWKLFKLAMKNYVINLFFIFPVFFVILSQFVQAETDPAKLPSIPVFFGQIYFSALIEDFFFYWGHRIMHHPYLYKRIHKVHHEFHNVICIASLNAHWIEFLFVDIGSMLAGFLILRKRMHMVTHMAFNIYNANESHEAHSGYEFPWSGYQIFPFSTDSTFHNFHHLKNIGNYSSFFVIWDTIFGTNKYYKEYIDKMADR